MSETEAVLIAAVIAAGVSVFVALSARKSQRDQVLWESRRDLFTRFVLAAKECQRLQEGVYTDDRHREERVAIEKLEDLYSRMAIEAPESEETLLIARCLIEHFEEINSVAMRYKRERDPIWRTRLRDEARDLRETMGQLQRAVHKELHRKG
ncbi:hypothetical protein AB0M72_13960 [Nocardiopsis dassonvillei]|uniref:hypothetical protein n=1 Tax=Nocardiopsis dassonvillei TaxID=2014 RepID=UPI00200D006D|nr:hypothetical protein [Nocardiopsis dassonvillei]MCK9869435.1 hypothetical protein [Nocardiopsis dassonvillei]